ncbi:MAG TPA: ZIP family metal transporter [Actinomycetota bacterium]|nr:ZIP family metal transporter [Actinomycetota bacterium]
MSKTEPRAKKTSIAWALIPLLLIALMAFLLIKAGPRGLFPGEFPPIEELTVGRVKLEPGKIVLVVTNGGPSEVVVSQVLVDDAFWDHEIEPGRTIKRLRSATVTIEYPWVEGEPVEVALVSSTGLTFPHSIEVATETPPIDRKFIITFGLLGIYIGLIPVLLGMGFAPFVRTLPRSWLIFFMAFTAGVLIFLGIETVTEALESAEALPAAFGGIGLIAFAAIGSFAVIFAASRWFRKRTGGDRRVVVAFLVAAGIGLHNLGEGLAVGAAYRIGQIALGAFLVVGFALHNTTEGLGIVSILGDKKIAIRRLALLGAIAGLPTVLGAWIGGFFFSPTLAAVFLAIAAGAIAEVVVDVMLAIKEEGAGAASGPPAMLGIAVGLTVMYVTGILIAA